MRRVIKATSLRLVVQAGRNEPALHLLCLVVPGHQDPALASFYSNEALTGTIFRTMDPTVLDTWGIESQTKIVHLLLESPEMDMDVDIVVPTGPGERELLRSAAAVRPPDHLVVVIYDSDSNADQAVRVFVGGDKTLWMTLGIGAGRDTDLRPLQQLL